MSQNSKISWTHHTFNPWWGCTPVSPGCENCYAARDAARWGFDCFGDGKPRRFFGPAHWNEPLKWDREAEKQGRRARVFCGSMCDIFEPVKDGYPDETEAGEALKRLGNLVTNTPNLQWLLLTKRPENAWIWLARRQNVMLGITAENQEWLNRRVESLACVFHTDRPRYFISAEPLLGPLNLMLQFNEHPWADWIIVGGESGPGARSMNPAWVRDIRNQCQAAHVPFFFKQWGEWRPSQEWEQQYQNGGGYPGGARHQFDDGQAVWHLAHQQIGGDLLDGQIYQEFPAIDVPSIDPEPEAQP